MGDTDILEYVVGATLRFFEYEIAGEIVGDMCDIHEGFKTRFMICELKWNDLSLTIFPPIGIKNCTWEFHLLFSYCYSFAR